MTSESRTSPCSAVEICCAIALCSCVILLAAPMRVSASTADQSDWEFAGALYGWFPDISGNTRAGDFTIDIDQILDNLRFTFQGSFDARRGRWGVVTDVIYMDVHASDSGSRDGTLGGTPIPVDIDVDAKLKMESWIWTTAGYYRAVDQPNRSFDLLAGVRYLDIDQSLSWTLTGNVGQIPLPERQGDGTTGLSNWDIVVGFRGHFAFGDDYAWFIPYHLDTGAGESDFTWQAMAGLGYGFGWGEVMGFWRYLDYDLGSNTVEDANFNGPGVGVVFRW